MRNIAVIGGGASGLTAAIAAARCGAAVTIYERCDRAAKKILATGNGRCNMTNMGAAIENYHGENTRFANGVINSFWVEETLDFFSELGIVPKVEENGKVYPYSLQAAAVSEVLRLEAERLGVRIVCNFEVSGIDKNKDKFFLYSYGGEKVSADCVILSAGGKASPNLGSNGSGYRLAEKFGHRLTKLYPSLVQVKTDNTYTKSLQGVKINGKAAFYENNRFVSESEGEILFTDYGLSGPPVFDLSRLAAFSKNAEIKIDLMPEFSEGELYRLLNERKEYDKSLECFFTGMLPKKLGQILLKSCGIAPLSRHCSSLCKKEISDLAKKIKAWGFQVRGTMSWNNAQVTAGGIDVSDIEPLTLESKLVKNLFFAGEIMDIDGDCGGYNLQWAWSSGYVAGVNAAGGAEGN